MIETKEIIKMYKDYTKKVMELTNLRDQKVNLEITLYEPKTTSIKQEHELGGGFGNAYKTPKLREIEEHELICKKIEELAHDLDILSQARELMNDDIRETIENCYMFRRQSLGYRAIKLDISRMQLHRNVVSEIDRVFLLLKNID